MYKPSTYLVITYFPTYLPTYETYFLQNWLPRWNQILTQVRFNQNWVIMGIQWMVHWWVPVQCGRTWHTLMIAGLSFVLFMATDKHLFFGTKLKGWQGWELSAHNRYGFPHFNQYDAQCLWINLKGYDFPTREKRNSSYHVLIIFSIT